MASPQDGTDPLPNPLPGVDETSPQVIDTTQAMGTPPFSSQYARYSGEIPQEVMFTYAKVAEGIMLQPKLLQSDSEFLKDYMATNKRILSDKAKMRTGITKLERELIELPRSEVKTIRLSELVIKPEIFDGEKP